VAPPRGVEEVVVAGAELLFRPAKLDDVGNRGLLLFAGRVAAAAIGDGDKQTGTTSLLLLIRWDDCEWLLLLLLLLADTGAPGTTKLLPAGGAVPPNWIMGP
jgi:hypothetical protein